MFSVLAGRGRAALVRGSISRFGRYAHTAAKAATPVVHENGTPDLVAAGEPEVGRSSSEDLNAHAYNDIDNDWASFLPLWMRHTAIHRSSESAHDDVPVIYMDDDLLDDLD